MVGVRGTRQDAARSHREAQRRVERHIDYISGRPVAALVYQRNKHWINVFVWPTTQPSFRAASVSRNGFNAVSWVGGGMQYWAVSDLGTTELETFGQTLQARIGDAS